MRRNNSVDRVGVHNTALVIESNFNWIFREQSVTDVGVDAIIEIVNDGEPTGEYIGLQIKSGRSNFYVQDDSLVYYISNVHYNYWLGMSIPMLIIAYDEVEEKVYWKELVKEHISKTKTRYKIVIPFVNDLSSFNSKLKLEQISMGFSKGLSVLKSNSNFHDFVEQMGYLDLATESINYIGSFVKDWSKNISRVTPRIAELKNKGLNNDSDDVKAILETSYLINLISARRVSNETRVFSEVYAKSLISNILMVNFYLSYSETPGDEFFKGYEKHKKFPDNFDIAISSVSNFIKIKDKVPEGMDKLKNSISVYVKSLESHIYDLESAKKLTMSYIEMVENHLK